MYIFFLSSCLRQAIKKCVYPFRTSAKEILKEGLNGESISISKILGVKNKKLYCLKSGTHTEMKNYQLLLRFCWVIPIRDLCKITIGDYTRKLLQ
jgi:hypothetical protein